MPTFRIVQKVAAALSPYVSAIGTLRVGVAVSGGPDSVALLGALTALADEYHLALTVLHVNHRLRHVSDDEQQFVETLAARWSLPCVTEVLTPPNRRSGREAWARTARYQFFQRTGQNLALHAVALAHTSDDQAETVLFRLLRGSARRGLAGIPPVRALSPGCWILRPLLDCTRQEVMDYLHQHHLPYVNDESNDDWRYTRNKIRHYLLPLLEKEFSPQLRSHLVTLAATFRTEENWLEEQATAARERVQLSPETLSLRKLAHEPQPLQMRILRQWLEAHDPTVDLTAVHLRAVHDLSTWRRRGSVDIPGNRRVRREADTLVLTSRESFVPTSQYRALLVPGSEMYVGRDAYVVKLSSLQRWTGSFAEIRSYNQWWAFFDGDAVRGGMLVRNFSSGDRIRPLGMQGHKKVHDIFVDAKVPAAQRRNWPLVLLGEEIVWVPGCVRSEIAKITTTTRWVCQGTVIPLPEK